MTDLYDSRIDAMKARERASPVAVWLAWKERDGWTNLRNLDRYLAYKRKRTALDGIMKVVSSALGSMGYKKA